MEIKTTAGQCFVGKLVSEWQLDMIVRRGEKALFLGVVTESSYEKSYMLFASIKGHYFIEVE